MADLRSTGGLGWTNKQIRGTDLVDFQAEILSHGKPAETADGLRIRLKHFKLGSRTFDLSGREVEDSPDWGQSGSADLKVLKAAQALFDRWASEPSSLIGCFEPKA